MNKKLTTLACVVTGVLASTAIGFSQNISVNATAGFTGWTESNSSGNGSQNGRFLGASGTSMDTSGSSWGLYANSGQTSASIYNFGETLTEGDYVEIRISLGFINTGGTVGFGLQNSSSTNRFEAYYIGGDATDAFKLNDAGGQENITGPTTTFASSSWNTGSPAFQTVRFTLGAANTYTLSFNGTPVTNTGLSIAASDIDRIRIFNFNAGSGSNFNQYFNRLEVVPEPSTIAMLAFGAGAGLLLWRKRRS